MIEANNQVSALICFWEYGFRVLDLDQNLDVMNDFLV